MMSTKSVEPKDRVLNGLLEIGSAIRNGNAPNEVLDTILNASLASFGAERGFLAIVDRKNQLDVRAARGLGVNPEDQLGRVSKGALNAAIEGKKPILAEDARQDPRFSDSTSIILHDIRAICVLPLILGSDVIGLLYLDNRLGEQQFSEGELAALSLFGELAAQAIDRAITFEALQEENKRLRHQAGRFAFNQIIGTSKAMEQVFRLMERVASSDIPVLLQGESGTGKELVARAIHNAGPRRDKPFLALFAGNLGEDLLESELFGHKKGSFTGAIQDKKGLLALAEGGTLLLDEVADIPPRIQAKLLRVLQDGSYKPVGETKTFHADVRILSATHQNLPKLVQSGDFREDLYYRINGIEVEIPPLRNRRDDIPLIAEHCLRRYTEEMKRGTMRFSRAALNIMSNSRWPGNVRELERTIQRAVVLCEGNTIEAEHLVFTKTADGAEGPEDRTLKAAEKRHILRILGETNGNRSEASRVLGVSRRYLQNLVKEWREEGIDV